jgi:tetratricopeptide (TPR) repeat protein
MPGVMRRFLTRLFWLRALAIVIVTVLVGALTRFGLLQVAKLEYSKRGRAAFFKGSYDEAISNYTKAIRVSPRYAKAFYNRGLAYFKKEQYDSAIANYSVAIELNPVDDNAGHT